MTRRPKGVPEASSPEALRRMNKTRRRDTKPETTLRRGLHGRGVRGYRIDRQVLRSLRRRADMVFVGLKLAVYVDGCFWHGCPVHATWPKANADFWRDKIETNRRRDADTNTRLEAEGWLVIRVWEHEAGSDQAADTIAEIIAERRTIPEKKRWGGLVVVG